MKLGDPIDVRTKENVREPVSGGETTYFHVGKGWVLDQKANGDVNVMHPTKPAHAIWIPRENIAYTTNPVLDETQYKAGPGRPPKDPTKDPTT